MLLLPFNTHKKRFNWKIFTILRFFFILWVFFSREVKNKRDKKYVKSYQELKQKCSGIETTTRDGCLMPRGLKNSCFLYVKLGFPSCITAFPPGTCSERISLAINTFAQCFWQSVECQLEQRWARDFTEEQYSTLEYQNYAQKFFRPFEGRASLETEVMSLPEMLERMEPGAAARCSYSSWMHITSSTETTLSLTYLVITLLYCFLLTHCEWEVDRKEGLVRSVFPSSADRLPLLQGYISQQQLPVAYRGDDDLSVTHQMLFTSSLLMIKKKRKKIQFSWSYKCDRNLLLKQKGA